MKVSLYYLKPEYEDFFRQSYDSIVNTTNDNPKKSWYKKVFQCKVDDKSTLDDMFHLFTENMPESFVGHDFGVSDVVGIDEDGEHVKAGDYYFCDIIGWDKLFGWSEEKKESLIEEVSPEDEYMELAKDPEKNEAKLREMVEREARANGYTVTAYHAGAHGITKFQSGNSAGLIYFAQTVNGAKKGARSKKQVYDVYLSLKKPVNTLESAIPWYDAEDSLRVAKWRRSGYDSIYVKDESGISIAVFSDNQIKSADPVTYDEDGNVIPLSERFNSNSDDIRESLDDNNTVSYWATDGEFRGDKIGHNNHGEGIHFFATLEDALSGAQLLQKTHLYEIHHKPLTKPLVIDEDIILWTADHIAELLLCKLDGKDYDIWGDGEEFIKPKQVHIDNLTEEDRPMLQSITGQTSADFDKIFNFIKSKGFDHIKYKNTQELQDGESIIVNPDDIEIQYPLTQVDYQRNESMEDNKNEGMRNLIVGDKVGDRKQPTYNFLIKYDTDEEIDARDMFHGTLAQVKAQVEKMRASGNFYNVTFSRWADEWEDDDDDLEEKVCESFDDDRYEEIDSKLVYDSDGFMTDYTLYFDHEDNNYFTVFGDKEIYTPEDSEHDWDFDNNEDEAWTWFNNYEGFTDEEDDEDFDEDYDTTKFNKYFDAIDGIVGFITKELKAKKLPYDKVYVDFEDDDMLIVDIDEMPTAINKGAFGIALRIADKAVMKFAPEYATRSDEGRITGKDSDMYRFIYKRNNLDDTYESLKEDTVKQGNAWVNKGEEGTHGQFKTKKSADAQRKAMFANGYSVKEGVEESVDDIPNWFKSLYYEAKEKFPSDYEGDTSEQCKYIYDNTDVHDNTLLKWRLAMKNEYYKKKDEKLIQSSSDKAFKKNVATEIEAGKPQKQALAIAYDVKRKNEGINESVEVSFCPKCAAHDDDIDYLGQDKIKCHKCGYKGNAWNMFIDGSFTVSDAKERILRKSKTRNEGIKSGRPFTKAERTEYVDKLVGKLMEEPFGYDYDEASKIATMRADRIDRRGYYPEYDGSIEDLVDQELRFVITKAKHDARIKKNAKALDEGRQRILRRHNNGVAESVDEIDNGWQEVSGRNGYRIFRKVVDGKGKWKAQKVVKGEPEGEPFDITYVQALGREPIEDKPIAELSKKLGKVLLPKREGIKESFGDEDFQQKLKNELQGKLQYHYKRLGYTPREIEDYIMPVYKTELRKGFGDDGSDALFIWVGAEVDYDELEELANVLNKVIRKYDKDAYFEPETSGRLISVLWD